VCLYYEYLLFSKFVAHRHSNHFDVDTIDFYLFVSLTMLPQQYLVNPYIVKFFLYTSMFILSRIHVKDSINKNISSNSIPIFIYISLIL